MCSQFLFSFPAHLSCGALLQPCFLFSESGSRGIRGFGFHSPQCFFFNPNKRKSAIPKKARPIIKEIIGRVPFIAKSNEIKDINIKTIAIIIL